MDREKQKQKNESEVEDFLSPESRLDGEEETPKEARKPPAGPLLKELHGLGPAKAWGEALADDIAAYKAGKITWDDVDRGGVVHGPPGTGKTLFAQAVAASCGVPLVATSYAEWQSINEGHLGDVIAAIKGDFEAAIEAAPSILFIDELDVLPTRAAARASDGWWQSVVAALLECLSGVGRREGVVVIAACNDISRIDRALLRAGRLEHAVEIGLPDETELEGIFRFHLRGELAGAVLKDVALMATGCTGADVERIVRTGRRKARNEKRPLALADLLDAMKGDDAGVPPELWRLAAIHEAGHAVTALEVGRAVRVVMSLAQRGDQRGVTRIVRRAVMPTRETVEHEILMALGGRAAEEIVFGTVSSGAGGAEDSDLAQATRLAVGIATSLGLSAKSPLLWRSQSAAEQMLMMGGEEKDEVQEILESSYARACDVITRHRAAVVAIAEALLDRRGLADEDIRELVHVATMGQSKQAC